MEGICNCAAIKVKSDIFVLAERAHIIDVHLHALGTIVVLFLLVPLVPVFAGNAEVRIKLVGGEFEYENHGRIGVGGSPSIKGFVKADEAEVGPGIMLRLGRIWTWRVVPWTYGIECKCYR
jgi:hypothetical protein